MWEHMIHVSFPPGKMRKTMVVVSFIQFWVLGDLKKIGYTGMPQLQCFKIPVSAFKLPWARAITIMGSSNFEKIQT